VSYVFHYADNKHLKIGFVASIVLEIFKKIKLDTWRKVQKGKMLQKEQE
jgi:hypothetical protein